MIEIDGLTKRYGDKTAVDQLSFVVEPGVVTGFLGPNGAGKSTTMRMIAGLDRPTTGTVRVNGKHYPESAAPMSELGIRWTRGPCTRACRPATTCWRWPGRPASGVAGWTR
jgi:ABC-2 type transport system ATP-binding protein